MKGGIAVAAVLLLMAILDSLSGYELALALATLAA